MSRDTILSAIRKSLGAGANRIERAAAAEKHLAAHPRHPIPERGRLAAQLRCEQFIAHLQAQAVTVIEVDNSTAIPQKIADYLREANLPSQIRCGNDPYLLALPWQSVPALERLEGPAQPDDTAGLSRAIAGAAETGTLVLASGPENPVTLAFLPPAHVIVVAGRDIVGAYEDAFEAVRSLYGAGRMPRTVNFVSGPSRTADIGGKIVIGAHGPRALCVIIVHDTRNQDQNGSERV